MTTQVVNVTDELNAVHRELLTSLEHAAAFAVVSNQFSRLPQGTQLPDPGIVLHYGAQHVRDVVKTGYWGRAAAFSVGAMIAAFDLFLTRLLTVLRFSEHVARYGGLKAEELPKIRRKAFAEGRANPVKLIQKLLKTPSSDVTTASEWLDGIYRIRTCLAHREGIVDLVDVDEAGVAMAVRWRRMRLFVGDNPVSELPFTMQGGEELVGKWADEERTWRVGEKIEISPDDCQDMTMALGLLAGWLTRDLNGELGQFVPATPVA